MRGLVQFTHKGNFKKTKKYLNALKENKFDDILNEAGKKGVSLLSANTPKRTGATASSWGYQIRKESGKAILEWTNSNMGSDGKTPVAILIQMGHGTRNGGYVAAIDFINPALAPLFDEIVEKLSEAVKSL